MNDLEEEKIEAWKRLRKIGMKFKGYDNRDRGKVGEIEIYAVVPTKGNLIEDAQPKMLMDLDTLFAPEK